MLACCATVYGSVLVAASRLDCAMNGKELGIVSMERSASEFTPNEHRVYKMHEVKYLMLGVNYRFAHGKFDLRSPPQIHRQ